MAKFPGGGQPNMAALMEQAQKMQQDMQQMQEEIRNSEFTGSAGGGAVKITMDGQHTVSKVEIDPELVDPQEAEMLCDLIAAAFNDANASFEKMSAEKLEPLTGGMKIPGF
jgi:DNA-binding YbaB/EbfC family protein